MQAWLVLPYLAILATLFQGMLVAARRLSPACARCGLPLERRRMAEPVCCCHARH